MRKRPLMLVGILVALLSLAVLLAACEDDEEDGGGEDPTATGERVETPQAGATVNVNLTEYIVAPDADSAPAGPITFDVTNIGSTDHEMVIIKTDLAPEALPTVEDGSVDEVGEAIEMLDATQRLAREGEEELTIDLASGAYVLVCNVVQERPDGELVSHYNQGMRAAFEVTE